MRRYAILLVDDDPLVTAGTGNDLKERGYTVTAASSGREAIDLLEKSFFDLVITDLVMAPVSGMEVLKRAKEIHPEIMVIILTGFGDMASAIDALRFDADDYLLKPCEPDEMYFRVARSLEKLELKRKIKVYEDILPVCPVCHKIRDDSGSKPGAGEWIPMEKFIQDKGGKRISSTYCPACAREFNQLGVDIGLDLDPGQ
jgi:DNA-binding NtrC family response regulator